MKAKRTPDERFESLLQYSFNPNYLQADDTEGAPDGDVVLLLRGQPEQCVHTGRG
ncbi:MAG: hypothetical protein QNL70_07215 [Pseudomonas sp.]